MIGNRTESKDLRLKLNSRAVKGKDKDLSVIKRTTRDEEKCLTIMRINCSFP